MRIRFRGSHPEAVAQYQILLDHIKKNNLRIAGFSREVTLIDYGITNERDKFVTEICIPVESWALWSSRGCWQTTSLEEKRKIEYYDVEMKS